MCCCDETESEVNHKRVHRVYREAGLSLRRKKRKHCVRVGQPLRAWTAANQEWALDFVHDFDLTIDEAAELHVSLKVIRQGCKQRLTSYLRCRAASELPQSAFAFDPSVRKLCHSCPFGDISASHGQCSSVHQMFEWAPGPQRR